MRPPLVALVRHRRAVAQLPRLPPGRRSHRVSYHWSQSAGRMVPDLPLNYRGLSNYAFLVALGVSPEQVKLPKITRRAVRIYPWRARPKDNRADAAFGRHQVFDNEQLDMALIDSQYGDRVLFERVLEEADSEPTDVDPAEIPPNE